MKAYIAKYTEDNGKTYHIIETIAKTYTDAYIDIIVKISKDGIITELFEVE